MDPRYMDTCEFDTLNIAPLQQKMSCGISVGPDLFRLVNMLGLGIN